MTILHSTINQRVLVIECVNQVSPISILVSQYFYQQLYLLVPDAENAFKGSDDFRHRKFSSTLQAFHNLKQLEQMSPMFHALGQRHQGYHRRFRDFLPAMCEALIQTLQRELAASWSDEMTEAWQVVFLDVAALLVAAINDEPERRSFAPRPIQAERRQGAGVRHDQGLLAAIGGAEVVKQVHDVFYEALFEDDWLRKFFLGKHESILSEKQTAFMVNAFGGESDYRGDMPAFVHMHMMITAEQADIREQYLRRAILSQGLSEEIADRWLAVDRIYRPSVVKNSESDCVLLSKGQYAISAIKPKNYIIPFNLNPKDESL